MLSIRTVLGPSSRTAKMRLCHSSLSPTSAVGSAVRPVATIWITSTSRPLPVPALAASIRCSGVGPSIIGRMKGRSSNASALARLA